MNTAERTAKDAQAAADRAGQMLADAAPLLDANHKAAAALTAALDRLLRDHPQVLQMQQVTPPGLWLAPQAGRVFRNETDLRHPGAA